MDGQVIRFTILSVGNICGIAEYTIKAARMRGLTLKWRDGERSFVVLCLDNIARDCVTWSTVDVYVGYWSHVYTLFWYANI